VPSKAEIIGEAPMSIEVRPIQPEFGAEVGGIDLGGSVDRAVVDKVWRAIDRYAVLVYHDQQLDDKGLRDFASNFGEL
jgi:alpha-ketoglutarate-dependent 2,4-dichlorophenoxyacetate dioxygenase